MVKGTHPGRISAEKIEAVYLDWVDGMSLDKLKEKYVISVGTIVKYRDENNWIERRGKIQKVVAKKLDSSLARRNARHTEAYRTVQDKCLGAMDGSAFSSIKPFDAIKGLDIGIKGEREILGDTQDEGTVITIRLPKGTTLGYRQDNQ